MKTTELKPYARVAQEITEVINRLLHPAKKAPMLPSLSEVDLYRDASRSMDEIKALVASLPQKRLD